MRQKNKTIFLIAFIGTIFYTGYGIFQLDKHDNGLCCTGLTIVMVMPFLFACTILLVAALLTKKTNFLKRIIFTTISLSIWTCWFSKFLKYSVEDAILYLGLFELCNILLLLFFLQQKNKNTEV